MPEIAQPAAAPAQPTPTTTPAATPAPVASPAAAAKVPLDAPAAAATDKPAEKVEPKIEVDQSVAKQYAELARQKAALAAKETKLAESERQRASDPKWKKLEAIQGALDSKNALAVLKAAGFTEADLAESLLGQQAPDPVAELRAELAAIKKEKADADAAAKAKSQAEIDAKNIAGVREKIADALKAAAPDFALTSKRGAAGVDLVFDTMEAYFVENKGAVLPFEKACAAVEKHYRQIAQDAADVEKTQAEQARQKEAEQAKGPKDPKAPAVPAEKTVSITNKTTADTPPGEQQTGDAANRVRAIRVFKERMAAKAAALSGKKA